MNHDSFKGFLRILASPAQDDHSRHTELSREEKIRLGSLLSGMSIEQTEAHYESMRKESNGR